MKIAVNTRLLIKDKLEGIGWFTYESFQRITRQHPEDQFFFIFDRPYHEEYIFSDNVTPVVLSPQARHPVLFKIWFDYRIPSLLEELKPDVFVSPDGYLSLHTNVKSLAVMHDLNFEHYPKDLPYIIQKYYRHYFPLFARKATRIATVSNYSKEDIVTQYGVDARKIDVVYDGSSDLYKPLSEQEIQEVRQKYTQGAPYFMFVGSLHPRKNLVNLFKAFDLFKKQTESDVKLLIVGEKKWWTTDMSTTFDAMNFSDDVIFCGRQKSWDLTRIMGAALALTYVSYFEGFGIPIAEAFSCGIPVITSNVTSMPEVAGDAALLIDPFDPASIAQAMTTLLTNDPLRRDLIRKGEARRNLFTWQRTADLLWESIIKTVNEK